MFEGFEKTGTFDSLKIVIFFCLAKGAEFLLFKNFSILFPYPQVKKYINNRKHQNPFFFIIYLSPQKRDLPS